MTTREHILSTLKSRKSEINKFGVIKLGLFGSYARNEQQESSDIDILIDFAPHKENFDNFNIALDFMESLFKNEKVEVVTQKGLSPFIGPHILDEVVYV